ncbi:MAG TPA: winged helix-turn-helix domain-containing protein [Paraburkholderia sp.]|uniref:ATP-binding protein n=1 Tax=Paraburkholderia sp. TaxID=1926495 RepID=UPI002DE72565|nr:winged helix-turn-helix domain-containing protein [Paraburkholderia sp.]
MVKIGALRVNFEQREMRREGRTLRVSSRAFDILDVLYRANGAIVSKDDIIDAVWPRQIVEENRLQVHIAALRKALGDDRELIKTVTGRGYLLVERSQDQAAINAPVGAPIDEPLEPLEPLEPRIGIDLPACTTPLVGRDDEVARILIQLEQAPVLTLAGAGGVGKTALAVRVAHAARESGARAVRFVELASAQTREAVLAALALAWQIGPDALGGEARLLAAIRTALPPQGALVVLDNAEHVIDIVAALVERLVAGGALRVLVTSREPLAIRAETLLRVEPLAVPPEGATTDTMLAHGAVALFLQRARGHAPACGNDVASIRLVADICRRLDGLPLAIELAAARVATLGIEGVAARLRDSLDDRLDLLSGGPRDASPRQQTLRATFDWSYALLDANAQALLRNLAFFAGTFTFEAVCAVAAEPDDPVSAVIATLGELIAKSLLAVEFRGAIALYRLTESTRAYAMGKLREEGALRRVGERHLRYLQPHIEDRAVLAPSRTLARARPSLDDARRAWDWAFSPEGDAVLGVALAGSLVGTLLDAGLVHECHERAARALDALERLPADAADSAGTVDALCAMRVRAAFAATVLLTGGAAADAARHWREVLKCAQSCGDDAFAARALWGLWNAAMSAGEIHASLRFATRLEVCAARAGTPWQKLCASAMLAASLHCFGEHGQARERLERTLGALDVLHANGAPQRVDSDLSVDPRIFGAGTLARIAWLEGDPALALQLTQRALGHVRADMLEPTLCHLLAVVVVPLQLACGDLAQAKRHLALLRSQAALHRFDGWQAYGACLAGQLDLQTGHAEKGLAQLEAGLAQLASRDFRRLVAPLEAICAQAMANAGRIDDALALLEAARRHGEIHGDSGFAAELLRVRGVVELMRAQRSATMARADVARHVAAGRRTLSEAMDLAHEQGARLLALRAALDLAASLIQDGALKDAAGLLAPFVSFAEHTNVPEAQRLASLLASIKTRGGAAVREFT